MPAPVLVVHDETDTRDLALGALRASGLEAVGFSDPMAALAAIETGSLVRVLVTRVDFGEGKLNGLALARMLLVRRSGVRTVFVARPEYERLAEGVGEFLALPLNPHHLVDVVARLLRNEDSAIPPTDCQPLDA
jgi:DNA-binding NtrC family response regulator